MSHNSKRSAITPVEGPITLSPSKRAAIAAISSDLQQEKAAEVFKDTVAEEDDFLEELKSIAAIKTVSPSKLNNIQFV